MSYSYGLIRTYCWLSKFAMEFMWIISITPSILFGLFICVMGIANIGILLEISTLGSKYGLSLANL